jgi:hypothetical protein
MYSLRQINLLLKQVNKHIKIYYLDTLDLATSIMDQMEYFFLALEQKSTHMPPLFFFFLSTAITSYPGWFVD